MSRLHNSQPSISNKHFKRFSSLDILMEHNPLRPKYMLRTQEMQLEASYPWSEEQVKKNTFPNTEKKQGLYLYIQDSMNRLIVGRSSVNQDETIQANPNKEDIANKHNDIFSIDSQKIVKCAGEMIFASHLLPIYINNKSGHFRPSPESFIKFAKKLYLKGLLSSSTEIEVLEKIPSKNNQEEKIISQKDISHKMLNLPYQDWHYSPLRKKPFDD